MIVLKMMGSVRKRPWWKIASVFLIQQLRKVVYTSFIAQMSE
ncbi:Uncharacterized protein dnm_067880 [Desulfonema magnum]|uniref:Uncharacterized protein n=1 Tax=Desulfonema magnum TaxID=45655 RepID=A0A975BS57_9BACT|nr:Uncharacterized protein dnm_067880 [Desulfonema magnum]